MQKLDSAVVLLATVVILVAFFEAGFYIGAQEAVQPMPQGNRLEKLGGSQFSAFINIVSVTPEGQGSVNEGMVEIVPGSGRTLVSLSPFSEPDTQSSMGVAAYVAQRFTGKSLAGKDIIFSIEKTPARLVGGPSAGAAMTVAAIAAIEGKTVRNDAAITGTINRDGSVGQIGDVIEKATAAAQKGLGLFVVPKGQKTITYYEQQEDRSQQGNLTIIRVHYAPKTIDLQQMLRDQNYSTRVVEVGTIQEAVSLLVNK